jgi:hypothetical protein
VNNRALRAMTLAGGAFVIALASVACGSSNPQPTPIIIYTSAPTATPAASQPATPVVTPAATPIATFTPWPSLAPTPVVTHTPTPTAAPTTPPSAGPTSPAASCTASAGNQAWFVQAANGVKFTVYCATKLASGWGLALSPQTTWSGNKSGGTVLVYYQYRNTTTRLDVCEGTFAATDCAGDTGSLGAASFGGLSGQLYSTADGFAIRVAPGTNRAYTIVGHNVTQATLVSIGAALKAVPKA